jgi:hypothetical protein
VYAGRPTFEREMYDIAALAIAAACFAFVAVLLYALGRV